MELIGLSGYARSGKDEAAKVLVDKYGFTRVAFADKLRDALYALNPVITVKPYYNEATEPPNGFSRVVLQEVIDVYGWNGYKETEFGDEIRRLAQRMGTEVGRQTLGENLWVDAALTGLAPDAKIVVTDCRFPNEARAIKTLGGIVVRVTRPGVKAVNAHPSETALDDWDFDYTLENNVDGLENWYDEVAYWYLLRRQLDAADIGG
jgi:hypothetical protein